MKLFVKKIQLMKMNLNLEKNIDIIFNRKCYFKDKKYSIVILKLVKSLWESHPSILKQRKYRL